MLRTIAFISQGILVAILGALGVLATSRSAGVKMTPAEAAVQAHTSDGIIAITLLIIVATTVFGILDYFDRKRDRAERETSNRHIAEIHAKHYPQETEPLEHQPIPVEAQGRVIQAPQTVAATAIVKNIADEVRAGRPMTRFELAKINSLRGAGLHLAKLYRDFASRAIDRAAIKSGTYLTDFWQQFPFGELDAIKERMENILGFEVASPAEELPFEPANIKRLAKQLQKEALKIPGDVPL